MESLGDNVMADARPDGRDAEVHWIKSSSCSDGMCVELALPEGMIRDSENPETVLTVGPKALKALIMAIQAEEIGIHS